jgi:hypothetical protein
VAVGCALSSAANCRRLIPAMNRTYQEHTIGFKDEGRAQWLQYIDIKVL